MVFDGIWVEGTRTRFSLDVENDTNGDKENIYISLFSSRRAGLATKPASMPNQSAVIICNDLLYIYQILRRERGQRDKLIFAFQLITTSRIGNHMPSLLLT